MKLFNLLILTLAAILAVGCSDKNEDTPILTIDGEDLHPVNLEFDISIDPASLTRSRELNSSECLQSVNDVRVYVFRSPSGAEGTFTLYHPYVANANTGAVEKRPYFFVNDFMKGEGTIWDDHTSGHETHTITIRPMLGAGSYRFLAVGRDDNPESSPLKINWTEGVTKWEEALMENENGHPRVTEIFSGYPKEVGSKAVSTLQLPGEVHFHEEIVLHRAVAGVLLHVKNIPQTLISDFAWYSKSSPTGIIRQDMEKGVEYKVAEVAIVAAGHYPTLNLVERRWSEPRPFQTDDSRFFATRLAWIPTKGLKAEICEHGSRVFNGSKATGNFVIPG